MGICRRQRNAVKLRLFDGYPVFRPDFPRFNLELQFRTSHTIATSKNRLGNP